MCLFQVTQFGCGGFVIGLIFSNTIWDGLGAAQFLNAVGELAKGLHKPTIQPVWHRDFLPTQPQEAATIAPFPKLPPGPPPMPDYQLQHTGIDIPIDQIHQLKATISRINWPELLYFWNCSCRILEQPNQSNKLQTKHRSEAGFLCKLPSTFGPSSAKRLLRQLLLPGDNYSFIRVTYKGIDFWCSEADSRSKG